MFVRSFSQLTFFLFVLACVVFLLVPEIDFWDALGGLFAPFYVDIPLALFDWMSGLNESVQTMMRAENSGAKSFFFLFLLAGTIALSFVLPLAWWAFITFWFWLSVYNVFPKFAMGTLNAIGGTDSPELNNLGHLVMGRTTMEKTYDAEVQANAIVSALNRQNRK